MTLCSQSDEEDEDEESSAPERSSASSHVSEDDGEQTDSRCSLSARDVKEEANDEDFPSSSGDSGSSSDDENVTDPETLVAHGSAGAALKARSSRSLRGDAEILEVLSECRFLLPSSLIFLR
jgi:hypothetical protein